MPWASSCARCRFRATRRIQNLLLDKIDGPAIGGRDGGIDGLVMLVEDQHQTTVADTGFGGIERAAGADRFPDIVELGECQVRMRGQHLFAERVQGFRRAPGRSLLPLASGNGNGSKQRDLE